MFGCLLKTNDPISDQLVFFWNRQREPVNSRHIPDPFSPWQIAQKGLQSWRPLGPVFFQVHEPRSIFNQKFGSTWSILVNWGLEIQWLRQNSKVDITADHPRLVPLNFIAATQAKRQPILPKMQHYCLAGSQDHQSPLYFEEQCWVAVIYQAESIASYLSSLWIPMLRTRQHCSSKYSGGLGCLLGNNTAC